MKHKLLFSILLLFSYLGVSAQSYLGNPHDFNRSLIQWVNMDKNKIQGTGISSRTVEQTSFDKRGQKKKSKVTYRIFYNKHGQMTREEGFNSRGKLNRIVDYKYNDQHQVIEKKYSSHKSGKALHTWKVTYHNDSLIATIFSYDKKGKQEWGYRYFYNAHNQITEQRKFDDEELVGRIEYDYYDDYSKKEVRYFKDSLKLEKTFRYDCGIGNSLLKEKQKDTLTQCSRKEELADGTQRTIQETRDEKGRIVRTVMDYNPEEKWSETRQFDAKNNLIYTYRREVLAEGKTKITYQIYWKGKKRRNSTTYTEKDNFGFDSYTYANDNIKRSSYFSTYTFFLKK